MGGCLVKRFFYVRYVLAVFGFIGCVSNSSKDISQKPAIIKVASWNTKHMGRGDFDSQIAASFFVETDIVTFQEVNRAQNGQEALKEIAKKLSEKTKEKICWALSEIPTQSQERYAYIWKNSKIAYVRTDGSVLWDCPETAITIRLGVKNADKIIREPAFGTFLEKSTQAQFVLASIHLVPSGKKPQLEVPPLFDTFQNVQGPIIIAGDYNLDSTHSSFQTARNLGFLAAMSGIKTSLKQKKRLLNKAYDNFWYKNLKIQDYRVLNLYKAFPNMSPQEIYKNISDHSPILATFEIFK